jgi:hypothetical protein
MYNEDEYLGEDAYSEVSSEETTSSVNTQIKERRKMLKYLKKMDKGYDVYRKLVDNEFINIESYSTPLLRNSFIRHAVDGLKCPHRAGSKYEDLYFVVADTTSNNEETRKLYYYSPEEFERHHHLTLSQEIKEKWLEKNRIAKRCLNQ